jgi:SAM-dependent methyltransferase
MESLHPVALAKQIRAWHDGLPSEVDFWSRWFESGGLEWPDEFEERMQPGREAPPEIFENLDLPDVPRVLDVGAGPMTVLGTVHDGRPIELVATDPLAPIYRQIADRFGVQRPVETVQAFAEDLSCFYDAESFDIVYCRNALDHSFDPVRGVWEMYRVAKRKGRIVLEHAVNEAEHNAYDGFHQWNFDERDGRFIIWNPDHWIDMTEALAGRAVVRTRVENHYLTVFIDKTGIEAAEDASAARMRVRELLSAQVLAAQLPG